MFNWFSKKASKMGESIVRIDNIKCKVWLRTHSVIHYSGTWCMTHMFAQHHGGIFLFHVIYCFMVQMESDIVHHIQSNAKDHVFCLDIMSKRWVDGLQKNLPEPSKKINKNEFTFK